MSQSANPVRIKKLGNLWQVVIPVDNKELKGFLATLGQPFQDGLVLELSAHELEPLVEALIAENVPVADDTEPPTRQVIGRPSAFQRRY